MVGPQGFELRIKDYDFAGCSRTRFSDSSRFRRCGWPAYVRSEQAEGRVGAGEQICTSDVRPRALFRRRENWVDRWRTLGKSASNTDARCAENGQEASVGAE